MYKKILIAVDGSPLAEKAVTSGLSLAKSLKSEVVFVTVREPLIPPPDLGTAVTAQFKKYEKAAIAKAEKTLARVQAEANKMHVVNTALYIDTGFPTDMIIETAQKRKCDLIVVASHGRRGIARILLGSHALSIVSYSKIPVLICR